MDAKLWDNAEPILFCDGKTVAYRYQNNDGQRFFVLTYEGDVSSDTVMTMSGLIDNPVLHGVLPSQVEWIARKPLAAYCTGNPELYVMCEQDENTLSIALFNAFADPITQPVINLGQSYKEIECVNCSAVLDGNKVTLTSQLHGFSMAMLRLTK